jgi:hypothetical protein
MTILGRSCGTERRSNFDGAGLFSAEPLVGSVQPAKRIHGLRRDGKTGLWGIQIPSPRVSHISGPR